MNIREYIGIEAVIHKRSIPSDMSEYMYEKDLDKIFLRPDFFEACCKGFLPAVQHLLTEVEQNHLLDGVKWIVLEQTMRFLTDFLDDNHYYKTSYPDQNLFRVNNQLALYRSILAQEQELHQIIQQNLVT